MVTGAVVVMGMGVGPVVVACSRRPSRRCPHKLSRTQITRLAMSVGLIPTDLRYDVAGETAGSAADGKVTAHDAQVIAKRAAQAARRGNQQ